MPCNFQLRRKKYSIKSGWKEGKKIIKWKNWMFAYTYY